jgi:membrane protease YdiL (CAAX protease family)
MAADPKEPAGAVAPRRWGLGDVLLGFAVAYGLTFVLQPLVLAATGVESGADSSSWPLRTIALLQIPYDGGLLVVAWLAVQRKGSGLVRDLGARLHWPDIPIGLAVGAVAQLLGNLIYLPLYKLTSVTEHDVAKPARELTDKASGNTAGVLLLVLVTVVMAPIVEELFFRGLVLRSAEKRWGMGWAIAFSSLLFGVTHFELLQLPPLALFGLIAALLTVRTGRLGPAIWAHVGFNALAVTTLLL